MIRLQQALLLRHGDLLHFHSPPCESKWSNRWKVNGKVKTWKTRPNDFSVPLKFGMGQGRGHHAYLTHDNAHQFHLAKECPINPE